MFIWLFVLAFIAFRVVRSSMNYEFGSSRKRTIIRMLVGTATFAAVFIHYALVGALLVSIRTGPTGEDPGAAFVITLVAISTGTAMWGFLIPKMVFSFVGTKPVDTDRSDDAQHNTHDNTHQRESEHVQQPVFMRQQPQSNETPLIPPGTPSPISRPTTDEWLVVAPIAEKTDESQPKRPAKPILFGAGVLTLLAFATIAAVWIFNQAGDSHNLAKCDTLLQTQLASSPQLAENAGNANELIDAIQDQRAADCPRDSWNPVVTNITRNHEGNIDVTFSTLPGQTRGMAVTMPADGSPRWVYLATQDQWQPTTWDSTQFSAVQPNSTPTLSPTAPTQPNHPQQPLKTIPAVLLPTPVPYATPTPYTTDQKPATTQPNAVTLNQSAQSQQDEPSSVLETQIGIDLQASGNHRQAIDHFTKALQIRNNPVARVIRAASYVETNQCSLAVQDAKQALTMEPESDDGFHSHAEAHYILSSCHQMDGDNAKVIANAKAALPLMEANNYSAEEMAKIHAAAGDSYTQEKLYAHAIEHYSRAIKLDDNAEVTVNRAWTHRITQNCNSALTDAGEAIKLPPVSRPGYHSSAEAYWIFVVCLGEADRRVTQHVETALRLMEENGYSVEEIALYNIWGGNTFYNHERYSDAIKHYSQSIELDETAEARVGRAWAYQSNMNCSKALADGQKALEMPNESWTYYRSRAQINSWAEAHGALSYCHADESQWGKHCNTQNQPSA